jgi:hypothetical protein
MTILHKYIFIALMEILNRTPTTEELKRAEKAVSDVYPEAFDSAPLKKERHSRCQVPNPSRRKNQTISRCSNFHTFDLSKVDNYMGHPICPVCKTVCWTLNSPKGRK